MIPYVENFVDNFLKKDLFLTYNTGWSLISEGRYVGPRPYANIFRPFRPLFWSDRIPHSVRVGETVRAPSLALMPASVENGWKYLKISGKCLKLLSNC